MTSIVRILMTNHYKHHKELSDFCILPRLTNYSDTLTHYHNCPNMNKSVHLTTC